MAKMRPLLAILLALALGVSPTAYAQEQKPNPKQSAIKVGVNLVVIPVTVEDPFGARMTGLEKENFTVKIDGVLQEIRYVSVEHVALSACICFDTSGSMKDNYKFDKGRDAVVAFIKDADKDDRFAIVTFRKNKGDVSRAVLTSEFDSAMEQHQNNLMRVFPNGETPLLDAVYLCGTKVIEKMRRDKGLTKMIVEENEKIQNENENRKKNGLPPLPLTPVPERQYAIFIISDGGDNTSRWNETDVKDLIKETDAQIYAIGIYGPTDTTGQKRTPEETLGPSLLREITELTGGRVFEIKNADELVDTTRKIGEELRSKYVLYISASQPESKKQKKPKHEQGCGDWRKIEVKVKPPRGLPRPNVRAKTGYCAISN